MSTMESSTRMSSMVMVSTCGEMAEDTRGNGSGAEWMGMGNSPSPMALAIKGFMSGIIDKGKGRSVGQAVSTL